MLKKNIKYIVYFSSENMGGGGAKNYPVRSPTIDKYNYFQRKSICFLIKIYAKMHIIALCFMFTNREHAKRNVQQHSGIAYCPIQHDHSKKI